MKKILLGLSLIAASVFPETYTNHSHIVIYDNNSNGIFDDGSKGFSSSNPLTQEQKESLTQFFNNENSNLENLAKNLEGIYFENNNNTIQATSIPYQTREYFSREQIQNILDYVRSQ